MITEKIQCFLFERKIKNFLSSVDFYKYCKKELENLKYPELETKSNVLKCIDLFKNKNDQEKYNKRHQELSEMINITKESIREKASEVFRNIPENCPVITKNFEIIIEYKSHEVTFDKLTKQLQREIVERYVSSPKYHEQGFHKERKFTIYERQYIIKNKGKIVYQKGIINL